MEIKTIQHLLDEYFQARGYTSFKNAFYEGMNFEAFNAMITEAMQIHAKQIAEAACMEQRKICAENAKARLYYEGLGDERGEPIVETNSILNTPTPTEYINSLIK